ncbi:cellulose binding domain-containing protein [Thermomonospora umbrina]|uniref:Cellulose binding domain-containing protein n=1 Tax=Thermomonospora umbrina TaxID=111806 RepID=A0A3D9STE5_9ACTN|nr:cellulose binding domain-containing protein [Thermomonospora umbrina]REE99068.1 cellulose binding domain-containing protein [Thermomonospora umbrina]
MGRHTKPPEGEDALDEGLRPEPPGRNWAKMLVSLPLLPMVALVIAIGVVSYAWGTSQISLNFAGGPPQRQQPQADSRDSLTGGPPGEATARQRGRGVLIAFRTVRRTPGGFTGAVTVTNRSGRPIRGWLLGFKFPRARVLTIDNSTVVRKGTVTWVRNVAATPVLPAGASVRLTFTADGTLSRPSACKFNKADCRLV